MTGDKAMAKIRGGLVRQGLEPTVFHPRMAELNKHQDWMDWQGFLAPRVFDSEEAEYFCIRNQASLFDVTPMCKYRIAGPDAEAVMNRLVTRDLRKLKTGRVAYVLWCDEEGGVMDDGTVFRLGAQEFLLLCQERQLSWLHDIAWGFDVEIEDFSRSLAGLALQGPTSYSVLKAMRLPEVAALKPFDLQSFDFEGDRLLISRTGFTGDLGYELWVAPEQALALWDRLFEAGKIWGLRPIGFAALDLARIEAGFIMAGAEFLSSEAVMRPNRARTPFELGLGRLVELDKPYFNGKRALKALAQQAPKRLLVGLEVEGNKPAQGAFIYHRKRKEVGLVTSAAWSPTCKRNLAYAFLQAPYGQGRTDDLWADIYVQKELKLERVMARCRIVERPFFRNARRNATPPAAY